MFFSGSAKAITSGKNIAWKVKNKKQNKRRSDIKLMTKEEYKFLLRILEL